MNWTYGLLMLFTLSGPLMLSWDKRVKFYEKIPYVLISSLVILPFYLFWDISFTKLNYWGFNPEYILGFYFYNLPLEEVSFFIIVPFACTFIYECIGYYEKSLPKLNVRLLHWIIFFTTVLFLIFNYNKPYPIVACLSVLIGLVTASVLKFPYLNKFWWSWFFQFIPFIIVNGILTYLPVVWYNENAFSTIRIGTIPIEDLWYGLGLYIANIMLYEWLQVWNARK